MQTNCELIEVGVLYSLLYFNLETEEDVQRKNLASIIIEIS
jgi:hypothetical protein